MCAVDPAVDRFGSLLFSLPDPRPFFCPPRLPRPALGAASIQPTCRDVTRGGVRACVRACWPTRGPGHEAHHQAALTVSLDFDSTRLLSSSSVSRGIRVPLTSRRGTRSSSVRVYRIVTSLIPSLKSLQFCWIRLDKRWNFFLINSRTNLVTLSCA